MNTANLRRLLGETTARPLEGLSTAHAELIVELVNNANELLAENKRLRAVVRAAKKFVEHVDSGCGWQCASCRNDDEDCDCGYIELINAIETLEQKP